MIFHRFEEEGLAHFSYVVGDESTGKAVVIDPRRDGEEYLTWIETNGLELAGVMETHLHADFVSGAHELTSIESVSHYLSAHDKGKKYEAQYDHTPVEDGETIAVGDLVFEALHTPGHTPEHLSYLLYEGPPEATEPVKFFTGDFLFVKSLGRPDLIGVDEKTRLSEQLFESVQLVKSKNWPDQLEIHPAHGAGSLCGAGLGEIPSSTLGEERRENPYFQYEDRDPFVNAVFEALGQFPPYYSRMKEINSRGAPFILPVEAPPALDLEAFTTGLSREGKNIILDLRDPESFGRGHIPGSYNLGLSPKLNRWAPWVLSYDTPIFLVGHPDTGEPGMEDALRSLLRVGLDDVEGYLEGGFQTWERHKEHVQTFRELAPEEVQKKIERENPPLILDVRTDEEYRKSHIPGAWHIMVGQLPDQLDALPRNRDREIITVCSSGYRSALAGSVLLRAGYENVGHLTGGFPRWKSANFEVVDGEKKQRSLNR